MDISVVENNKIQMFTEFSDKKGAFSKKQTFYLIDHQNENSNLISNHSNLLQKSSQEQSRTNES